MNEPDEDFAKQLAAYVRQLAMDGTLPTGSLEVTAKPGPGYRGHLHGLEVLVPDPHVPGLIRKGHIAAVFEERLASAGTVEVVMWAPGKRPSDGKPDTGPGAAWLALIPEGLPTDEYVNRRSSVMEAFHRAQGAGSYALRAVDLNEDGLAQRQKLRMELAELATRAFPTDRDAYERFTRALGLWGDPAPGLGPKSPRAEVAGPREPQEQPEEPKVPSPYSGPTEGWKEAAERIPLRRLRGASAGAQGGENSNRVESLKGILRRVKAKGDTAHWLWDLCNGHRGRDPVTGAFFSGAIDAAVARAKGAEKVAREVTDVATQRAMRSIPGAAQEVLKEAGKMLAPRRDAPPQGE